MYFSIIIPLYNKDKFILRAVNSILNQSYQFYEIIVIDDGSTDNSYKIIDSIESPKLKKFQQTNKGVSVARNKGAEKANFDFLVFLDADDEWDSNFLENICLLIRKYPGSGIFATNNYFILNNGSFFYNKYEELFKGNNFGIIHNYFDVFLKYGNSPFSNSNFCIKKDLFFLLGGYKEGVTLTEDSDLWCRAALISSIAYCKLPLSNYYVDIPNNTNYHIIEKNYQVTDTLLLLLESNSIPYNLIPSVKKLIAHFQLNCVKKLLLNNGSKIIGLRLIFKTYIFKYFPFKFFFYLFLFMIPNFVLIKFYETLKYKKQE
jgi:glycosyltransferase involved in cell wall biosynthesis